MAMRAKTLSETVNRIVSHPWYTLPESKTLLIPYLTRKMHLNLPAMCIVIFQLDTADRPCGAHALSHSPQSRRFTPTSRVNSRELALSPLIGCDVDTGFTHPSLGESDWCPSHVLLVLVLCMLVQTNTDREPVYGRVINLAESRHIRFTTSTTTTCCFPGGKFEQDGTNLRFTDS